MSPRSRSFAVLVLVALAACQPRAEAEADTTAPSAAAATTPSLFDRMGGMLVLHSLVDSLMSTIAADTRINKHFQRLEGDTASTRQFKQKLVDQLCEASGGPCVYSGLDMRSAHNGMNLRNAEFDALLEDIDKALDGAGVAQRAKDDLLRILQGMRGDIVTRR